jgi:hypothetical protein
MIASSSFGQLEAHTSRDYLRQLYEYTGRNTIYYYSAWLEKNQLLQQGVTGFQVSDNDKDALMATIHGLDRSKGLDLVLHTPGGGVAATESIVEYLRALQPLPAAPDAFVWLRLYQAQLSGLVPAGRDEPLWWTLRRPLGSAAARAMCARANAALGLNWSLHDLRHTAAYRMA